ncbi:MAG: hypothetical protein K6E37_10765 [Bacteroidales bacterium]|nr:hypothetical protein [Bacteroidales bacterium]
MKTRYILLAAMALFAFSCTPKLEPEQEVQPQSGERVTIKVSTSESLGTKVTLTEASDRKAMNLEWEDSDILSINGNEFSVANIISAHEAEFNGTAPASSPYTIIYPGSYTDAAAFNARSYTAQAQSGNSSTAHLEYNAMLSGVNDYQEPKFDAGWAAEKGGALVQNGVIQLRLQLPDAVTAVNSVSLLASREVFPTTNAGDVKVAGQTLAMGGAAPANHIIEAYMMFSAAGVEFQAGDELSVIVDTPDAMYVRTLPMTAQTWTGGSQYTIQCKVLTENSFEINNASDLETFRDGVNSGSMLWATCQVKLGQDIDCSSISGWTPIGNGTFTPTESGTVSAEWTEPAFKGTFDGQGFAIKNLVMTSSPETYTPYGLFGILYGAKVKNLILGAASGDTGALTATPQGRMDAGALAGVSYGSTIENVTNYFPMTIPDNSSANRVALGMVGYVYGDAASGLSTLSGLNNYGKVTATQSSANTGNGATGVHVAGIAGFGNTGASSVINQINTCTNHAEIDANTGRCAGILGAANSRTAISGCNNRGYVHNSFNSARVGGICVILGSNASITSSHNYGNVEVLSSGSGNVGGIVCLVNSDTAEISGSSNEGAVTGATYVGGIAANLAVGTITQCVNTGAITGTQYVGGIVGRQGNNTGWPYLNKCRSNATITASSDGASCAGGIAGQMLGGVLNTCFAKGAVVAAGYDVGGIVGQMYCNQSSGQSYGRMYVYDCVAAANVTSSRTTGAANLGGVIGRLIRKNDSNNSSQYMAVDNCIGLNQMLSAGARTYVGAFVGQVTAGAKTNHGYVRVRNNISLVEDANMSATSGTNRGGFVGAMPYGLMQHAYYVVSDNSQTIGDSDNTTTSDITKSDAATLTSDAFCSAHSSRATGYSLNVNGQNYKSTGWTIPSGCSYPVPSTLAALGEDYYK